MKVIYDATLGYEDLFQKANETLGFTDGRINSLVTYYQYLDELIEESPEFLRIPLEEEPFVINTSTRAIAIPTDITNKSWVIGVKDDHMAEVLFFKVDRFFDGQDLAVCFPREGEVTHQGQTYIQWKNGSLKGLDAVTYVEIQEEVIYFGWVLAAGRKDSNTGGPLSVAGDLTFSVRFQYQAGVDNEGHPDLESQTLFSFNTLPVSCKVQENLIQTMGSEVQGIYSLDVEDISEIENVRPRFSGIFNNVLGPKPRITVELSDWTNLDENGEAVLSVEATVAGGGELIYKWTRNGELIKGANTNSYTATETGVYNVLVGHQYDVDKVRYDESVCEIPGPSKIAFEQNGNLITGGIADGETILEPKVKIIPNQWGEKAGELHYEWHRTLLETTILDEGESGVIDNPISTEPTYTPPVGEAGRYQVKIYNVNNNEVGTLKGETALESIEAVMKAPPATPDSVTLELIENEIIAEVKIKNTNDLYYRWTFLPEGDNTNPGGGTDYTLGLNKYPYYGLGKYSCDVKQVVHGQEATPLSAAIFINE